MILNFNAVKVVQYFLWWLVLFFFFGCTHSIWKFLDWQLNVSHSWGNAGSFDWLHQAGDWTYVSAVTQAAIRFLSFFKQASEIFIAGKQRAPRMTGMGEKSPPPLSYRGFYPLKMGGGTNVGSRKMWFSPTGLAQLLISVLVQKGS